MKAILNGRAALVPVFALVALPVLSQPPADRDWRAMREAVIRDAGPAATEPEANSGQVSAASAAGARAPEVLTLFQDDGGGRGSPTNVPRVQPPVTPSVVLKGIYRLGDTFHVSLQRSDGTAQSVQWQSGSNAEALGGYQIQDVDARIVTMSAPAGTSCQMASGTTCVGRNQMALTLEPTQPRRNLAGTSEANSTTNGNEQLNGNNGWGSDVGNTPTNNIRQPVETDVVAPQPQNNQQRGRGFTNDDTNNNAARGGRGRGGVPPGVRVESDP